MCLHVLVHLFGDHLRDMNSIYDGLRTSHDVTGSEHAWDGGLTFVIGREVSVVVQLEAFVMLDEAVSRYL